MDRRCSGDSEGERVDTSNDGWVLWDVRCADALEVLLSRVDLVI